MSSTIRARARVPAMHRALLVVLATVCTLVPGRSPSARDDDAERRTPVVRAVERASPAVVNISTEQIVELRSDPMFDEFFRDFFDARPRQRRYTQTNLGSGVIVRANGYEVTNAHVVARGAKIRVTLADEREFDAKVVGSDAGRRSRGAEDRRRRLPAIDFTAADDLMIGETVIAIGKPVRLLAHGHDRRGERRRVGRSTPRGAPTSTSWQTDASINPGNSGGPLLNVKRRADRHQHGDLRASAEHRPSPYRPRALAAWSPT
jgi:serine protease Do